MSCGRGAGDGAAGGRRRGIQRFKVTNQHDLGLVHILVLGAGQHGELILELSGLHLLDGRDVRFVLQKFLRRRVGGGAAELGELTGGEKPCSHAVFKQYPKRTSYGMEG